MLIDTECPRCYGNGRVHSPTRNGDPFDEGVACPECEGSGTITVDIEDEIDD